MSAHRHRDAACPGLSCIAPPYLLERIAESGDEEQRAAAQRTLDSLSLVHARRVLTAQLIADPRVDVKALGVVAQGTGSAVKVYDAHGLPFTSFELPGTLVRDTDDPPVADVNADQAFDGARATLDVLQRRPRPRRHRRRGHGRHLERPRHRPARPPLGERRLELGADGLRRRWSSLPRRIADVGGGRDRPRADPRRDAVHGRARVPQPVRRAQREHVRRLRLDGQAARARARPRRPRTG